MEMLGKVGLVDPNKAVTVVTIGKEAVVTAMEGTKIQVDYTFANCPELDAFLIPGGFVDHIPGSSKGTAIDQMQDPEVLAFVKDRYAKLSAPGKFLMTVCTGAAIAAAAGILDDKTATTNKMAFTEVKQWTSTHLPNSNITWRCVARWVEDGNVITSSGISAGTDMCLHFIAARCGVDVAETVRKISEWTGQYTDPDIDPFASGRCVNVQPDSPSHQAKANLYPGKFLS
jgi:transcriptional regulator GlxA family with amidase domain